jgi:hypothetical protein
MSVGQHNFTTLLYNVQSEDFIKVPCQSYRSLEMINNYNPVDKNYDYSEYHQ